MSDFLMQHARHKRNKYLAQAAKKTRPPFIAAEGPVPALPYADAQVPWNPSGHE